MILQDPTIAGATYELFLDGILYETQASTTNVPPAGMSTSGWERFKDGGYSSTERDWATEMSPPSRLALFKTRLVEWIAPCRRWALFMGNNNNNNVDSKNDDDNDNKLDIRLLLGCSRTVALLATASGDSMQRVTELASQYLKQHFDSQRETGGYGNPAVLSRGLLALSVGGINADSILNNTSSNNDNENQYSLGLSHHTDVSFRRRAVDDSHFSEMVSVANKAMAETTDEEIISIGKLTIVASDKMLSKLRNALGLSLLRGKPYIVAAESLNGLVTRLGQSKMQDTTQIFILSARALAVAVQVLTPVATTQVTASSASMSEANVAVRDSIYGTISIISRSLFAKEKFLCLMAGGKLDASTLSTDLIQLLFRCVGNEVDKLRPKATSTLDALLFACCSIVEAEKKDVVHSQIALPSDNHNPWGSTANEQSITGNSVSSSSLAPELAKSILPLLWNAAQKSRPRHSRIASAKWSADLLINLHVTNGTHILCYIAGDSDVTASAIAREGLGLFDATYSKVAEFSELVPVIACDGDGMSRHTYWDFSSKGKAVTIKCLLRSYLDDFHSDDEETLQQFMSLLTKTLANEGR